MLSTKGAAYTNKRIDPSIIVLITYAVWSAMEILNRTWLAGPLAMAALRDVIRCFCLVVLVIYEVKFGRRDRLSLIGLLVAIGLAALALHADHLLFFDSIWFIYVSRDIPLRMLTKVLFITITLLGSIVIIASLIGVIPNISYVDLNRGDRYKLGFGHPNTGPAFSTFAFIMWAYLRDRRFGLIDSFVILGIEAILFLLTKSRTALILTVTLVIIMLTFKYLRLQPVKSVVLKLLFSGTVVIVAILSITLSLAYNPNIKWIEALNSLMSGRLFYSHWGIEEYGVTLLGQQLNLGAVSIYDLATGRWIERALILDNLYVRIPLNCGLLFFINVLVITFITNWRLVASEQYRLLSLVAIAAVYGVMENVSSFLLYNSLLFLMALPLVRPEDRHNYLQIVPN